MVSTVKAKLNKLIKSFENGKIIKDKNIPNGNIEISLPKSKVSAMIGQKRSNVLTLEKMGYNAKIIIGENDMEIKNITS